MNQENFKRAINSFPALFALGIITVALLAFYSNSFTADWHYDDFHHVKENINIRKLDNIPLYFKDPTTFSRNPTTTMYRPLLMATHALNYAFGIWSARNGYDVIGYHVVNFLFHLLTTFAVFLILHFLFRKKVVLPGLNPFLPAIFGSLLFGLHTINTETVVYISSRSAGMATFFVTLAFFYYIRSTDGARTSWFSLCAGAVFYALGLLSKETAITLPGLVFLYELLFNRNQGETVALFLKRMTLRLLPFVTVAGVYFVLRKIILSESSLLNQMVATGSTAAAPTFQAQISTQIRVWVYYMREFLWPTSLSIDKPFQISIWFFNPRSILSLVVVASAVAWVSSVWRKYPLITLGTLWFFIALLPESLFRLNVIMNDHRLYLPSVGAILVITFVASQLYIRFRSEAGIRLQVFLGVLAVMMLLMGLGTFKRNMVFATEETIWKDVILKDKFAVRGYNNLGIYYEQHGDLNKAERFYKKTAQLAPLFPNAYINLGNVYHKKKQYDKAINYMKRAIELDPESSLALYNLGNILREAGRETEAIASYRSALRYNPRYIEAANNVANIYFKNNKYQEAVDSYRQALDIDPTFGMSYYNLALAYENMGKLPQALEAYQNFLRYWDGENSYRQMARQKINTLGKKFK